MQKKLSKIRVLIVDDDEEDFLITSEYIRQINTYDFIIDWCYQSKQALEHMLKCHYDIYFVDYLLGGQTGLDLIRDAVNNNCEEPIVLLTGKGNHNVDMEAMKAGAFDYLVKSDLNAEKLERSIRYSLEKTTTLKALRINERKFRNFFEKSRDAVFFADNHFNFRDVNFGTENLFGYSRDELRGLNLYDLLHDKDDRQFLDNYIHLTDEINDMELDCMSKSGEKKPCIVSITKTVDVDGQTYLQGIIHDITNLKKAEKANLQVEKLAATGRLVRLLAHEIRNPLTNIHLSIDELGEIVTENSKIYLEIIERNSRTINDLIIELLNSSKPLAPKLEKISIQSVMDLAIEKALDRMKLKRIALETDYPESPAWIDADPEKLNLAFLNIIINSVEAIEDGKGTIRIAVEDLGTEHIVSIEDNGCGISEESVNNLFEPYFTSKRNGLGLGLASTLNIMKSHNGTVNVQSKLGAGTKFLLTLKKSES